MGEKRKTIGRKGIIILICCISGFAVRFLKYVFDPVQPRDAYTYELDILEWEKYDVLMKNYSPLSLWLLSFPGKVFKCDTIRGGIAVNLLLGTLIIAILIWIVGLIFKRADLMLAGGVIAATHPSLIRFSTSFLRENTYLFFILLAILYSVKYLKDHSLKNIVLIAVYSSFALLCRLEALEFVILFLIFLGFDHLKNKTSLQRIGLHYVLYIVLYSLTLITLCWSMDYRPYKIHRIETKFDFEM